MRAHKLAGSRERNTAPARTRKLVDHAAKAAVALDWDLSSFCDLAAKAFERHGGRVG